MSLRVAGLHDCAVGQPTCGAGSPGVEAYAPGIFFAVQLARGASVSRASFSHRRA